MFPKRLVFISFRLIRILTLETNYRKSLACDFSTAPERLSRPLERLHAGAQPPLAARGCKLPAWKRLTIENRQIDGQVDREHTPVPGEVFLRKHRTFIKQFSSRVLVDPYLCGRCLYPCPYAVVAVLGASLRSYSSLALKHIRGPSKIVIRPRLPSGEGGGRFRSIEFQVFTIRIAVCTTIEFITHVDGNGRVANRLVPPTDGLGVGGGVAAR